MDQPVQETLREKLPYVIEVNRLNTIANNYRLGHNMAGYNETILCLFDNLIPVVKKDLEMVVKNLMKTMNKELKQYDLSIEDKSPMAMMTHSDDRDNIIKHYTRDIQNRIINALDKVNLLVSHKTVALGYEDISVTHKIKEDPPKKKDAKAE